MSKATKKDYQNFAELERKTLSKIGEKVEAFLGNFSDSTEKDYQFIMDRITDAFNDFNLTIEQ